MGRTPRTKGRGTETGFGETARDLKDHVSERAVDVAQSATRAASEAKEDLIGAAGKAADRVQREAGQVGERASEAAADVADQASRAYGRAVSVARTGYETAANQVAVSPMSSLVVAAIVGLGVGWMLRGAHEEDRRAAWMRSLPDYLRRRMG